MNSGSIDKDNDEEVFISKELKKALPELCDVRDGRDADTEVQQKDRLFMTDSYTNTMPAVTLCK